MAKGRTRGGSISNRKKRSVDQVESLVDMRKLINARVVNMILGTLTEEQRELLAATTGNPNIESKLEKLVQSLLGAERVIRASGLQNVGSLEEELTNGKGVDRVD